MRYSETITDLISRRYSCRKFRKERLKSDDVETISSYINKKFTTPFNISLRFKIVYSSESDPTTLKNFGTYGFIKNPSAFIIGAVEKGPHYLEAYGFSLERIVIQLSSMNIGSCWLGGSFTKSSFALEMQVTDKESVPAVLAIGYPSKDSGLVGSLIRWSVKAKTRKAFAELFFQGDFSHPLQNEMDNPYHEALEMVRLAPSASNKQPWRIVQEGEREIFHFFLKRNKGYREKTKKLFNMSDLQRVDMGIAMSHFELVAEEKGIDGSWQCLSRIREVPLPDQTEYVISWVDNNNCC